jgi:hypothetical protein
VARRDLFDAPLTVHRHALDEHCAAGLAGELVLRAEQQPGLTKSNVGGWHSAGNLLSESSAAIARVNDAIAGCLSAHLCDGYGHDGSAVDYTATGWAMVNRVGDRHVAHRHDGWTISGTLYLAVPADMTGGQLVFEPPPGALAAETVVAPEVGLLVLFPAWATHRVAPFTSAVDGRRVALAFNINLRSPIVGGSAATQR